MRCLSVSLLAFGLSGCLPKGGVGGPTLPDFMKNPESGCSVGTAKVFDDMQIAMDAAAQNGRTALAAAMTSSIEQVLEQAREQLQVNGDGNNNVSITSGTRQIVDRELVGTSVKYDQVGSNLYAQVCIDSQTFSKIIAEMNTMSTQMQEAIREQPDAVMSNMDEILAAKRAREAGQ